MGTVIWIQSFRYCDMCPFCCQWHSLSCDLTPVVLSSLGPVRPPTHSVAARMHKAPAGCRIVSELCAHAACTEYIYRACPSPSYEGAWLRWRLVARTAIIVKLCKVMP